MSSVVISGDTSGTVTLQAPAIAGSVVVTLPAASVPMNAHLFLPLTANVAANALTATLAAGAILSFNDGTSVALSAAITVTASSGSTFGTVNAQRSRIWVIAVKNSGTPELAIFNALSGTSIASIPLGGTISTTAEGGAGAADSAQVWYSTTARASQPFCVVGYIESTQATAGTWATSPTAQGYGMGIALPNTPLQTVGNFTGAVATGTTAVPFDDTIPQNTEGDQYLSQAITPTSAANLLRVEAKGFFESTAGPSILAFSLFQDATANALATSTNLMGGNEFPTPCEIRWLMLAGTVSSTTLKCRAGSTSGTTTFNGQVAGRKYGGALNSHLYVQEIQA